MGRKKQVAADKRKEDIKKVAIAKLNDCPTSPRKMRLVADMVRGVDVFKAMNMLKHSSKEASVRVEKLLRSAIANWEAKNEGLNADEASLVIKEIYVDSASMLKRLQTAPQGRAYRVRKRSNHVTLIVDSAK